VRNTTETFSELLHANQNVFIWVPVGAPRPDSYPYNYDKKLPSIAFPQKDRNTCVTSSFASCLHCTLISDSDFQTQSLIKSDAISTVFVLYYLTLSNGPSTYGPNGRTVPGVDRRWKVTGSS
jgi:hypothetical protein